MDSLALNIIYGYKTLLENVSTVEAKNRFNAIFATHTHRKNLFQTKISIKSSTFATRSNYGNEFGARAKLVLQT